ncbi:CoA transferase [Pseudomaricurvus alkylphenolicus]|uniref:CaiB/BaiF CoA transferase family protein n=1 Tax=Pseudomaricurvus alkylphenolicus TaxID=1306991 RepID=UPI0014212C2B|nr:CaiB/BaiF CoA-transferase family protein [Pseudomaricurvus alkylphenolicus]NIB43269.1 CoA transferase [Pseudomaricurvus alkylphenolicus]
MTQALSHLKVLDLSRVLAGPWAGQLLADFGADVIKVERPGKGDDTRSWGPPFMPAEDGSDSSESAYFMAANRGKRSVCLDITTAEGQAAVRQLAGECDVVLENFKVGGAAKYGLDYDSLAKDNPGLIYCSITGFGQEGPYSHRPGYDFLVQAMGGLMSVTGEADGEPGAGPQKVGVALTDIMTGLYATIGILTALAEREKSGLGQYVDLALLDVTAATLANQATNYLVGGMVPGRLGNAHPNIVPYQSFTTNDGHCIVAVGNDDQFRRFCEVIGEAELANDERYHTNAARVKNRRELVPVLQHRLLERSRDEWLALFEQAGVPAGPINTIDDVFDDPQIRHRQMRVNVPHSLNSELELPGNPIKLSRTPVNYDRPPPMLGEHTEEVMQQYSLDFDSH